MRKKNEKIPAWQDKKIEGKIEKRIEALRDKEQ